jgi:integrase/recombinase XerC
MRFDAAVDEFIDDWQAAGRINSKHTVAAYRYALECLGAEVSNRDPRTVGREDVKRTLARWPGANTQRARRAALAAFFDHQMEEGYRKDNPARQTRRPKKAPTNVYRLTKAEVQAMMEACATDLERRVVFIGICAGLRNGELCGLQGKHFQRPGLVWVSADIAKGARERYIPVVPDLQPVWTEIHRSVPYEGWVLPGRREGISAHGLRRVVARVAARAGIEAHVYPHLLRHAFGDHIARYAGIRNAQFLLGHANVGTTEIYTGKPTLDDLAAAVGSMTFLATPDGTTGSTLEDDGMLANRRYVY